MDGAIHVPVLLEESLEGLNIRGGGVYVDATLGGGGHSRKIAERLAGGLLVSLDRDTGAVEGFRREMEGREDVKVVRASFADIGRVCGELGIEEIDGVLYDLGLSSMQLAAGRGFSFHDTGALDMRYGEAEGTPTAADFVNTAEAREMESLFWAFDERRGRQIAQRIIRARGKRPIVTAADLVEGMGLPKTGRTHPATKVFLALRAHVNGELEAIRKTIPEAMELLRPGGRIVMISYHSSEDRIVKDLFRRASRGCSCERQPDECECNGPKRVSLITRRPMEPSDEETAANPRARSAKLRIVERIG